MKAGLFPTLALLALCLLATRVAAAPASVAVDDFIDDEQAEEAALNNEDFTSTAPIGPQLTVAIGQALTRAGIAVVSSDQAQAVLRGRVTAAWVNSAMLPTNSASAHYQLLAQPGGAVLAEGNASGTGFNSQDALQALAGNIAAKVAR